MNRFIGGGGGLEFVDFWQKKKPAFVPLPKISGSDTKTAKMTNLHSAHQAKGCAPRPAATQNDRNDENGGCHPSKSMDLHGYRCLTNNSQTSRGQSLFSLGSEGGNELSAKERSFDPHPFEWAASGRMKLIFVLFSHLASATA